MGAHKTMHQLGTSQARRWALGALPVGGAVVVTTAFRAPQIRQTTLAPSPGHHHAMMPTRAQAEFDQLFIDMLVPHHQSAIDAAQLAPSRAVHQEIKELAAAIIRAQQSEIDQMKAWRLTWYGAATSPTALPDAPMNMPGMNH
jgi:uncharacterized protein (DUF305 family)